MIMSMDGNNSLKRLSRPNHHTIKKLFPSNYYLTSEEVDLYKNEVKSHVTRKDITETPEAMAVGGDIAMCTDHWKAANADANKRTYKEFEQSGIFLSACRHGFILFLTDMICSGEL